MGRVRGTKSIAEIGPPPGPVTERCKAPCGTCGAPSKGSTGGRCRYCRDERPTFDDPNSW